MDAIDRKILSLTQEAGRLSAKRLSELLGLSPTQSSRRLHLLEASGAIAGYGATLSPQGLGLDFEAMVLVTLDCQEADTFATFERAVIEIPQVAQTSRLDHEVDYVLQVLTEDRAAFLRLRDEKLSRLTGVRELSWAPVAKHLRRGRTVPV